MVQVKKVENDTVANGDHLVTVTLDDGGKITAQAAISMWHPTAGLQVLMTQLLNKALVYQKA